LSDQLLGDLSLRPPAGDPYNPPYSIPHEQSAAHPRGEEQNMPLSERTIQAAWRLAEGRCECTREGHGHGERCGKVLQWHRRGELSQEGWEARPWTPINGGHDEPENVEVLCMACFQKAIEAERRPDRAGEEP
jgi:hypothetical protein